MTTFIDARASALGIPAGTTLSVDQRIALDLNTQVEKHQLAIKDLTTAVKALALTDQEKQLVSIQLEAMVLHVIYDRHLYATQGVDVTFVPSVVPPAP